MSLGVGTKGEKISRLRRGILLPLGVKKEAALVYSAR
jgi:hypothetical protein